MRRARWFVVAGVVIGVLVCGQMLYNFTLDNLRHYGAIKAMGASNRRLVGMVLVQALTVGALGYGLGLGAGTVLDPETARRRHALSV